MGSVAGNRPPEATATRTAAYIIDLISNLRATNDRTNRLAATIRPLYHRSRRCQAIHRAALYCCLYNSLRNTNKIAASFAFVFIKYRLFTSSSVLIQFFLVFLIFIIIRPSTLHETTVRVATRRPPVCLFVRQSVPILVLTWKKTLKSQN